MSHVTTANIKIRDLDALKDAVASLGGEMTQQPTYAWWGHRAGGGDYGGLPPSEDGKCLYAIKVAGTKPKMGQAGPWEIGVVPAADGDGYRLLFDYFGSAGAALEEVFGSRMATLGDEYAAEVAMRQLARQGFRTVRTDAPLVNA
jgi:hypothetical protein